MSEQEVTCHITTRIAFVKLSNKSFIKKMKYLNCGQIAVV